MQGWRGDRRGRILREMDAPSTPSPVALRGRKLDRALCEAEPARRPWSERLGEGVGADAPPLAVREDTAARMRAAEEAVAEAVRSISSAPLSLRGSALESRLTRLREQLTADR
jgi:hypothetical protein